MNSLFASVNWQVPSWDLFIYLFFAVSVLLYGLSLGRERVLTILMSIYVSLAVSSNLPFIKEDMAQKFGFGAAYVVRLVVFAVLVFLLFFLFSKMGVLAGFSGSSNIGLVILFSVLHVGLLISTILAFLPAEVTSSLAELTRTVFIGEMGRFFWIVAPIAAMFLVRRQEPAV